LFYPRCINDIPAACLSDDAGVMGRVAAAALKQNYKFHIIIKPGELKEGKNT